MIKLPTMRRPGPSFMYFIFPFIAVFAGCAPITPLPQPMPLPTPSQSSQSLPSPSQPSSQQSSSSSSSSQNSSSSSGSSSSDSSDNPIASPFKDIRMRKAVSLAINRQAIADRVMDGLSAPAGQFSPKGYIGYSDNLEPDSYDLTRAKELMAEAGYADGFKLTMHGPAGRYLSLIHI